jgi:phosphate transport system substrate-binding protein
VGLRETPDIHWVKTVKNQMRKTLIAIPLILGIAMPVQTSCSLISSPVIRIEGSSTLYPLTAAVTEEYLHNHPEARIAIGFSGTGGGIRKLIQEEADITDASRPITSREQQLARSRGFKFIELPVAYDGIVVAVNADNTWCESLTVSELRRIWNTDSQNRLTLWSQIRPEWPEKRIFLFGPGTGSGTLHYFSASVLGSALSIRGDFSSSEDDNLSALALRNNPLGMGFFGYSYYEKNRDSLKLLAIDDENPGNGDGPVKPGVSSIMDGTYQPLSRPLFLYVRSEFRTEEGLGEFLEFYLRSVPRLAFEVGLVPLPEDLYALVGERLRKGVSGSMYEGLESGYGISVADLLRRDYSE